MMIPFLSENPYLTIITPMAESANLDHVNNAASALLCSILAVAAFSRAGLVLETTDYTKLGEAYYERTLRILSRCFHEHAHNEGVVVLAAITITNLIDVFRPVSNYRTNWRLHLRAGRQWMRSRQLEFPSNDSRVSILIELVLLVEVLGFSGKRHLDPSLLESLLASEYSKITRLRLRIPALEDSYNLDRLFGLPRNVFECILWTNLLVHRGTEASREEIDALGFQIASSDPSFYHYQYPSGGSDVLVRKCIRHLFYYASELYYQRQLLRAPVDDVQWIVSTSIPYMRGLLSEDHELQGSCLSWPIFIIAAEATDPAVWESAIAFFNLEKQRGIGNYAGVQAVLQEIWRRRRDSHHVNASLDWAQIMDDMSFDILLV